MAIETIGGCSFTPPGFRVTPDLSRRAIPLSCGALLFYEAAQELHEGLLNVVEDHIWPAMRKELKRYQGSNTGKTYALNMGSAYMGVQYNQSIDNWKQIYDAGKSDHLKIVFSGLRPVGELDPAPQTGFQKIINEVIGRTPPNRLKLPIDPADHYDVTATGILFRHNGTEWQHKGGGMTDNGKAPTDDFAAYGMELIKTIPRNDQTMSYTHQRFTGPGEKSGLGVELINHLYAMDHAVKKGKVKLEIYPR